MSLENSGPKDPAKRRLLLGGTALALANTAHRVGAFLGVEKLGSRFEVFPKISLSKVPNLNYIFTGADHEMGSLHAHFEKYLEVIRNASYIHLESGVPDNFTEKYLYITQAKTDNELKARVMALSEDRKGDGFGNWFRVISAIAGREGKMVIFSDPSKLSFLNTEKIGGKLSENMLPKTCVKYLSLLVASVSSILGLKMKEKEELLNKMTTGSLATHVILDQH